MSYIKSIFIQTLMISTGILTGIGIHSFVSHLSSPDTLILWQWYIPLSIIFTGFLCSIPTLILLNIDSTYKRNMIIRIFIHFIITGIIVIASGYFFHWYKAWNEFILIIIMYVGIYVFVWVGNILLAKIDERKINEAIESIRDEE